MTRVHFYPLSRVRVLEMLLAFLGDTFEGKECSVSFPSGGRDRPKEMRIALSLEREACSMSLERLNRSVSITLRKYCLSDKAH